MTTVASGAVDSVGVGTVPVHDRVNTKAARRRLVAYSSLSELWEDLNKIERSHRGGTLRKLGNHGGGANFAHIAMVMKGSFDGFAVRPALLLRILGRMMKKRLLSRPFQPGFNLSKNAESAAWDDSVTFDAGLAMLREQVTRVGKVGAVPGVAHPFFGNMTVKEWQVYYLRHAELHLSFLQL